MDFPKDCPIKGTPMEPVTTREWELLVKAIDELKDMVAEKMDALHSDLSSQKNRLIGLEKDKEALFEAVNGIKTARRWRWEHVVLPLLIGLVIYMLPHFSWKP